MIKLTDKLTELLCKARKIEALVNALEREMDGISSRDLELVDLLPTLSPRELEYLTFLTTGEPYELLPKLLNVSQKTIETFRFRIKRKLKLSSSKEIASVVIPMMKRKQK